LGGGLAPKCVVTRAMSKKENSEDQITLADTVISQVLEGESPQTSVFEPFEVTAKGSLSGQADKMSASQFIAEKHKDSEGLYAFLQRTEY